MPSLSRPLRLIVVGALVASILGCGQEVAVVSGPQPTSDLGQVSLPDSGVDLVLDVGQVSPDDGPGTPDPGQPIPQPDVQGCDGEAFCPCEDHQDCDSELCLPGPDGLVCSVLACIPTCPDGWSCAGIVPPGGNDLIYACVFRSLELCKPCQSAADCTVLGFEGQDQCVSYGDAGSFCGNACSDDDACLDGYTCKEGQCVATTGECGCSSHAVAQEAGTACSQANAHGICQGTRRCTPEGLTDCDAVVPQPETCDGQDNNCSGVVDDIGEVSCDITGTFGTCIGALICEAGSPTCVGLTATAETCNGQDDDCNSVTDDGYPDLDGDGLANCVDPDDDNDGLVDEDDDCPLHPDPDQLDTDFDGDGDACDQDDDNDGSPDNLDCAPLLSFVFPSAEETCDGVDNDCDGATDEAACSDGNVCTDDLCDPVKGCLYPPNQAPCTDSNQCTTNDACVAGACQGSFVACNDANPCTDDACDPQLGCLHAPNTLACSDASACTLGDVCAGGVCLGGPAVSCDDANPCTADTCNPALGCTHPALVGVCDDEDACTTLDACQAGTCVGQTTACDDGDACTLDTCDAQVGCTNESTQAVCDDGNACTQNDTCVAGECQGQDQGCECQDDADCEPFEDDDLCNGTLFCDTASHTCETAPDTTILCPLAPELHPACAIAVCVAASGTCQVVLPPAGVFCLDGTACTQGDSCASGQCAGLPVICDDGAPCTLDSCNAQSGCVHQPADTGPCDDGSACTEGDACQAGVCAPGQPVDCSDGDACTGVETCDPAAGCAAGTPLPCDNSDLCDGQESCDPLDGCVSGAPLLCDDAIDCTADSCHPETGCATAPNDALCAGDTCLDGVCTGSGCAQLPTADGTACDLPQCTTIAACQAGICDCPAPTTAATAQIRFGSVSASVSGAQARARLVVTPTAGGRVQGDSQLLFTTIEQP
jgi:hypothetical protein